MNFFKNIIFVGAYSDFVLSANVHNHKLDEPHELIFCHLPDFDSSALFIFLERRRFLFAAKQYSKLTRNQIFIKTFL